MAFHHVLAFTSYNEKKHRDGQLLKPHRSGKFFNLIALEKKNLVAYVVVNEASSLATEVRLESRYFDRKKESLDYLRII